MTPRTPVNVRRAGVRATSFPLRPLVLALFAAFPVVGYAQAAIARPAAPAPAVVPRPMVGWRVSGTGASLPVNTSNSQGGTNQVINQTSTSGIYNWQSFDIGAASSVTFNFPTQSSSALNRVTGSTAPSQIFGSLTSQYANPDPTKAPLVGGSIYLINSNGVLFGRNAQVNVGSLIASTLDLKDSDYLGNLTGSIGSVGATFAFNPGAVPSLFTDSNNFVVVDPGANITTASGGRVFLFAKNVQNAGTISAPDGQVALAGGQSVYLENPTAETIYASEANPSYPVVRGLLVEVGGIGANAGSASNLVGGTIATARGNTTLVGMAVNQMGRINATTSVSQNGSVFLLARGGAVDGTPDNPEKHATVSGALTLGSGSSVEIAPDTTPGADGKVLTSDGNSVFTASRVEMAGKTISLQSGASVVAHGGIVNVRAEGKPDYRDNGAADYTAFDGNDAARIVVGDDVTLDVSGTDTASVSAARNYVTTQLLGKSDLKDAPLQKDGPLYRSKVTFDVRSAVPILGDTSVYQTGIQRDAVERLAAGGSLNLSSTGAVVTAATSTLNVSGGQVNYTQATASPTTLVAANGALYSMNNAPKDVVYTAIQGVSTPTQDRWGTVAAAVPSQAITVPGYVDGRAGGTLTVSAPHTILDGHIAAGSTNGARQTAGLDALAAGSSVNLGLRADVLPGSITPVAFGDTRFVTSALRDLDITANNGALPASFWADPLNGALPTTSRISAATINGSGLGKLVVTTDGGIAIEKGADLSLARAATVDLASGGSAGITLAGDIHSEGGTVTARTRDLGSQALGGTTRAGAVTLAAGTDVDVSGDWVNRALDGATAVAATAGGTVTLSSARSLVLEDASRIDVSGGATVSTSGAVAGTSGGSITLESDQKRGAGANDAASAVHLGATLVDQSLVTGGTLALHGMDAVTVGNQPLPLGVQDGLQTGSLQLSSQFFDRGAFARYDIQAFSKLDIQRSVVIAPQASNWLLTPSARGVASGTRMSSFLTEGRLLDAQRSPVSVSLSAVTPVGAAVLGDLVVGAGAAIVTDPLASVTLKAGRNLDLEGRIAAPGGTVALAIVDGAGVNAVDNPVAGSLVVGPRASIDVSGTSIRQPVTGAYAQGQVVDGGSVSLSVTGSNARLSAVDIAQGAVIAADGASDVLGVTTTNAAGSTSQDLRELDSNGGSIAITAEEGGAVVNGALHAQGGGSAGAAGTFSLSLSGLRVVRESGPVDLVDNYAIVVQDAPVTQATAVDGVAQLSASSLADGFANVTLHSMDRIRFNGDVSLKVAGNVTLDAPLITASPQSRSVAVQAGGALLLGATPASDLPTPTTALPGSAALSLNGDLVEFYGMQGLQGFQGVTATGTDEIRLAGVQSAAQQGKLSLQADLALSAPQVSVTSGSAFTIDAPGQRVLLTGGDRSSVAPLSAGGSITVNASDITTVDPANAAAYGVLRAPLGQITLNASDSVVIGSGSDISVSGAGQTVLYGSTVNGANWTYDNHAVTAPTAKSVTLAAPVVDVNAGATIDNTGGGNLIATEFVAGPGGSKDIFAGAAAGAYALVPTIKGFAPQDFDVSVLKDATGAVANVALGKQITIGAGGPVPAGTYALLPARYALLDGAFLVKPVASSAPLALGATIARQDGSVLVGGQIGTAGLGSTSAVPQTFQLFSSKLAQTFSQVNVSSADTYFAAQAQAAGTPVPKLPQDAGRLNIAAQQVALKGTTLFTVPKTGGVGGELDLSADHIQIGDVGAAPAGTLALSVADLNATTAALLVIGGTRSADGSQLTTGASTVTLDNGSDALKGADLVLLARDSVELKPGASIVANATSSTGASDQVLALQGDGALLRVSADPAATTMRTGAVRAAGDLVIDAGASLTGGAVTAEATHSTVIAGDTAFHASAITLGASRIAVGSADDAPPAATTLVITPTLSAQFAGAQSLTLRSFDGIDLSGNAVLGGSGLQSLTIDTGALRLVGADANATIAAGGITLLNSSGSTTETTAGGGQLNVTATGTAGGSGQIVVGPGSSSVSGAAKTTLSATNELVVSGQAQLQASGDLALAASALQATAQADASLASAGVLTLSSSGGVATAAAGGGAHVALSGAAIEQSGRIVLPSGQLSLSAATGDVHLASGAAIDLAGRDKTFDGVVVSTSGGDLQAQAVAGNVRLDAGSTVGVSAGSTGGAAGSVSIAASSGSVSLDGVLSAVARAGQAGGQLSVDSGTPLDLDALQRTLAASAGNFTDAITLRNRSGDQVLAAGGPGFTAQHLVLQSDAGSLTVAGRLDTGNTSGGSIVLAAGDTLTVAAGANLSSHSTGNVGGQVQLMAGNVAQDADGNLVGNGRILLNGGLIDVGAATPGGAAGSVLLRAQRTDDGQDVRISQTTGAAGTAIAGATALQVEAVKQYQTDTIDDALIDQVNADNVGFAGTNGANAARVTSRVGALLASAPPIQLRAGVEVDQLDPGTDLVMTGSDANHGWNLTAFDSLGQAIAQPTGAPVNLTLRAAGNLDVLGSISDGFVPAGTAPTSAAAASVIKPAAVIAQSGGSYLEGGTIRLVGGADLGAANVMSTRASADAGDVTLGSGDGSDVIVRTTTGNIQIAAGRDVVLTDHQAVVYTTGTPTTGQGYVGLAAQAQSLLRSGTVAQSPTLTNGGSVTVTAQRDVAGAGALDFDGQYVSEWLWRGADATTNGQATWWARYDRFQQGFATFGGGNMTVAAGRDALNVEAASASSGYIARDAQGQPAGLQRQGGGDLSLTAARDIVNGQVLEDAGTLTVRSGRDIVGTADAPAALQVLHGASQIDVEARNDATVGLVTSFGLVSAAAQAFSQPSSLTLVGAASGATLRMAAGAGDLDYLGVATTDNSGTAAAQNHAQSTGIDKVIPDVALFAAPAGSVAIGTVVQVSGTSTDLSILASKDATVSTVTVGGTDARQATPTLVDSSTAGALASSPFGIGLTPYDDGNRDPVRVVAQSGDLAVDGEVNIVKPIRLLAGRDIAIAQNMAVQQQGADELSLVQGGRDVLITKTSIPASLKVQGPGDLVVMAGRNVALNTSGGVGATGNRENAALPGESATITVLAGVSLGKGDYTGAFATWFPILGGTGVAAYAADLAAQLDAAKSGGASPGIGSAAAAAFKSASIADQVAHTKSLVGDAAFDAAVLADAQRREDARNGDGATVDLKAAQASFAALADADKLKVVGTALATAWATTVPKAQQTQDVLAWVAAQGHANTSATTLPAFIAKETGQAGLSLADSLTALAALAPERQAIYTNQVLLATIRAAGREASALAGADRTTAYAKAYDALAVVFPDVGAAGNLDMGSSQLRSYQDSAIDVLTPRGGVNVGALASTTTPKSASDTGIVTGAGGDISMVVRDDVSVNQSRVFTVGQGDLLIWSSYGNIDAGRGAKTVTGAPPPVFRFDPNGNFVIDTSGSYSGSGIAVLNADSTLDLYAPVGEINAGDAGIKSLGNAFLGAAHFVGADNLSISGAAVGAPPVASSGGETAGLAAAGQSAAAAGTHVDQDDSEDEKARKRRKRLNLILDFLGFGEGAAK